MSYSRKLKKISLVLKGISIGHKNKNKNKNKNKMESLRKIDLLLERYYECV
jgi:hypothetical protein